MCTVVFVCPSQSFTLICKPNSNYAIWKVGQVLIQVEIHLYSPSMTDKTTDHFNFVGGS